MAFKFDPDKLPKCPKCNKNYLRPGRKLCQSCLESAPTPPNADPATAAGEAELVHPEDVESLPPSELAPPPAGPLADTLHAADAARPPTGGPPTSRRSGPIFNPGAVDGLRKTGGIGLNAATPPKGGSHPIPERPVWIKPAEVTPPPPTDAVVDAAPPENTHNTEAVAPPAVGTPDVAPPAAQTVLKVTARDFKPKVFSRVKVRMVAKTATWLVLAVLLLGGIGVGVFWVVQLLRHLYLAWVHPASEPPSSVPTKQQASAAPVVNSAPPTADPCPQKTGDKKPVTDELLQTCLTRWKVSTPPPTILQVANYCESQTNYPMGYTVDCSTLPPPRVNGCYDLRGSNCQLRKD